MIDTTPRKLSCIVALSEHWDYTQTAIANRKSTPGRRGCFL